MEDSGKDCESGRKKELLCGLSLFYAGQVLLYGIWHHFRNMCMKILPESRLTTKSMRMRWGWNVPNAIWVQKSEFTPRCP